MGRTLIVKLGAMGDIVRTTPVLHVLDGEIYWVTRKDCRSLLPVGSYVKGVFDIENVASIADEMYDTVLSLDDDREAATLASLVRKRVLIGSYVAEDGSVKYTKSAAPWFDMGIISRFGLVRANELKQQNPYTYQQILFRLVGRQFRGEEYVINPDLLIETNESVSVGIESRAGERWPMKQWNKYKELVLELEKEGYSVRWLEQRDDIREYVLDIAGCKLIVCGDTLAMHIALALNKPVVALFICTSPQEIYGYGRLTKIVSPYLNQVYYSPGFRVEAVDAIQVSEVLEAFKTLCNPAPIQTSPRDTPLTIRSTREQ